MTYSWVSFGNTANPIIALIAPSNGFAGIEGQRIIKMRIDLLVKKGFCIQIPRYDNDYLVIQSDAEGRNQSNRLGSSISPAVDSITGKNQIIDCIKNGWNIMPFMGGDSFGSKIALIVDYFKIQPSQKNLAVRIFGMSNATYATVLASHNICQFISTPFSDVFTKESLPEYREQAQQLELLMKGELVASYNRTILSDPDHNLSRIERVFHHPINIGIIMDQIAEPLDSPLSLNIPDTQDWSLGFEGFLQKTNNVRMVNYTFLLDRFLQKYSSNLPKFIEIGIIASRLDGYNGYANLKYDDSGNILIDPTNLNKILRNQVALKEYIQNIKTEIALLEAKDTRSSYEQQALEILKLTPQDALRKASTDEIFNESDIVQMLASHTTAQNIVTQAIIAVAAQFNLPVVLNSRNGHCSNMSIVNSGLNSVTISGDQLEMTMLPPLIERIADERNNRNAEDGYRR